MAIQVQQAQPDGQKHEEVAAIVDYLPATEDFTKDYPRTTTVETIRTDAKTFFAVQDRQERDTYFYYLVFRGERVRNTQATLEQLVGEHEPKAHFSLVEEITAGGTTA
jgi:hypothetical protein